MNTTYLPTKYLVSGMLAAIAIAAVTGPASANERPSPNAKIVKASAPHGLSDREYRRWQRNNRISHDERRGRYGYGNRWNRNNYYNRNWQPYPHDRYYNRIPHSWTKVRGKIIQVGRGYNQGCFRVKRKGNYQGERAIVTVKYCENRYGKPVKQHGSKRLVRYLGYTH